MRSRLPSRQFDMFCLHATAKRAQSARVIREIDLAEEGKSFGKRSDPPIYNGIDNGHVVSRYCSREQVVGIAWRTSNMCARLAAELLVNEKQLSRYRALRKQVAQR